jgi:DNA-binding MarR family transcriptional regulator
MKEQENLLKEIALMLERQDMLSKLTESQCLDEYGYSETHCIDYIGRLELPNVTKIADHMGMTRGAISKMTKKLLTKGLIEKYTLETNRKEIYFRLTDQGVLLFDEHAKRHKRWEKRDMEFLSRYSEEEVKVVLHFMKEFNVYLEEQIAIETNAQETG